MKTKRMNTFKELVAKDGNLENRAYFRKYYAEFENYRKQNYGKRNFWGSLQPRFVKILPSCVIAQI